MITGSDHIFTDSSGRELISDSGNFPLYAHDGDVHWHIASCISFHWHNHFEFYVQQQGPVQIDIGEERYLLKPGNGCFINSGVLHSFTATQPEVCRYRSFVADPGIIGGMPGSIFDTGYVKPFIEKGPAVLMFSPEEDKPYFEAFQQLFSICSQEPAGYELKARNALSDIFLYAHNKSTLSPAKRIPPLTDMRMKQMLSWIDENLCNTVTLEDIACAGCICPRECQRIFRRCLHYTPMEYLRQRRLLAAADQLSSTNRPITEIALELGFSSPSHFSMQFRKLVGQTPADYRKAIANLS